ncbi:uncharacterized protein LOC131948163 [Physella acuta]|uniref:uncharacterized protein LOC131948163 n=1 Tax=Physella acuta TaxID=109671 RepID=UPI0027DDF5C5|nr:uncharacterized protein LOC131948163 [Physella acuta]
METNEEKIEQVPTGVAIKKIEQDPSNSRMTDIFYPGNHEAEMCYGGEADLHKHVTGCKKNPGHKGFIPLKDFNASYLPSRYHDDKLMSETIKTLAALTVQVKTKFTSPERPEFYPGTQIPYPCYKDRGSHVMRLGTGRVWRVDKYRESDRTCPWHCVEFQVSATPSKVWGKVSVGQWTHRRERDGRYSRYTRYWYTTCTCPGSSGAFVYRLGYDGLLYQHPHSGSNSEGNYSGEM